MEIRKLSKALGDWQYFLKIEFIGLTLVHKTIQVSSVQLNKTSSVHCIVCPSPHAKSLSVLFCPTQPTSTYPPPFPLPITTLLSASVYCMGVFFFFANRSFIQSSTPPALTAVSTFHVSMPLSILFISLFYSLDSTYK